MMEQGNGGKEVFFNFLEDIQRTYNLQAVSNVLLLMYWIKWKSKDESFAFARAAVHESLLTD